MSRFLEEVERQLDEDYAAYRQKQIERFIRDVFHLREVPEDDASALESGAAKR